MQFKVDENLPREVADLLQSHSHDAKTVNDQSMVGRPDDDLAEACRAESRTLITIDTDFADIRTYPPQAYSGIIVLRPTLQSKQHVLNLVAQMIPRLDPAQLIGFLWVVDEGGIRVRTGTTNGAEHP